MLGWTKKLALYHFVGLNKMMVEYDLENQHFKTTSSTQETKIEELHP
jgi:hypothetical protein